MTAYDNFAKLLEQPGLDAVLIATPSKLHARMVREALDKGLHVFCEKPFCLDPRNSRELAELATQKIWSTRSATTTASSAPSTRPSV